MLQEDRLSIIYRDSWLLAINKPPNVLSVPSKNLSRPNCYCRILQDFPAAKIVHRLDEPTSGILIFALDSDSEKSLHQQFRQRKVIKEYISVVQGIVQPLEGKISAPLKVDWPNRPKQKICWQEGKEALTQWKVLRHDRHSTRIKLSPVSGRTHQLRLHMQYVNHPIIGDPLYGDSTKDNRNWSDRMLLHAMSLCLLHPVSLTQINFRTVCPF